MNKKFIDQEEAVSPIIGTILMVAITVIMAAIISSWSAGIKAPESPQSVGLDVSRTTQKNVTITILSIDPPQTVVTLINASFKNGSGVQVTRTILGDGAPNSTGTSGNGFDVKTSYTGTIPTTATIGDSTTLYINDYSEFLVLTVKYGQGTTKAIYSQKV